MVAVLLVLAMVVASPLWAQSPQDSPAQPQGAPGQQAPAAAGGPQGDIGPYSVPKKKPEPPPERTRAPRILPKLASSPSPKTYPW